MQREIPEAAISKIAQVLKESGNKNYSIPVVGQDDNPETPQVFEMHDFHLIDETNRQFFAIDGSYKSEEFYNGICVAVYAAGYVGFSHGVQLCLNSLGDPLVLGRSYYPSSILITSDIDREAVYDELFTLPPVVKLLQILNKPIGEVFVWDKKQITRDTSSLLSFCSEVLEWGLTLEITDLSITNRGDVILRDGDLRSINIRQDCLLSIAKYIHNKGVIILGITKNSAIKNELSYTYKQIDNYLQDSLKYRYNFVNPSQKKLCAWLEVPQSVLNNAFKGTMYARVGLKGGRGCGVYHTARLDYVEKLQNYDWVVADLNIFDVIPNIENGDMTRSVKTVNDIFMEITRLTQEHYILGYPYPLVEAHNFVSINRSFNMNVINRVKLALYREQIMDHADIENIFLDTHDRF